MTNTPVEYVENGLGAHKVWEDLQDVVSNLAKARQLRDELSRGVKNLRFELEALEVEIIDNLQGAYANLVKPPTQAQIDRDMKSELAHHEGHVALRRHIVQQQQHLEAAETEVRTLEGQARAFEARLNELAAILNFYASCKQAETQARQLVVSNPAVNWPY